MSEDMRVSLPMMIRAFLWLCSVSTVAAARPMASAISQVSSLVLATPRTPSVPKYLPIFDSSKMNSL